MVNVVGPVNGTVEAPPLSVLSLKLPSGLVTVHDSTPLVFQNTDVRVPRGTLSGTAQIWTSAGTEGSCVSGVAGEVVLCLTCWFRIGCEGGSGMPTW